MSSLYQNINAYFHIISVESDTDIIGFEALSKYDIKNAFKYDVTFIMTSTADSDAIEKGNAYCDMTIQLTEQVITIKRTYTKLIEALGDVGGLMEFIFSFFRIISSFLTETLYEKSLVNSLFSFDLDKKTVSIKKIKGKIDNNLEKKDPNRISGITDEIKSTPRKLKENDNLKQTDLIIFQQNTKRKTIDVKGKNKQEQNRNKKINTRFKRRVNFESSKNIMNEKNKLEYTRKSSDDKDYIEQSEMREQNIPRETSSENRNIINKIRYNSLQFSFCFLCIRKFKNTQNALMNEGMKLITEELDIRNLFQNMLRLGKIKEQFKIEDILQMSDECKNKLVDVNKKLEVNQNSK